MRRVAVFVILLFASCAGVLRAQSTNASITGRVSDPSKAVIVDAKVAAINAGTNVRYEGATNGSGEYYLTYLPAGSTWWRTESRHFPDGPFRTATSLCTHFTGSLLCMKRK